jgi:hypothetical protein
MAVSSDSKDPSLYDGLAYFVPLLKAQDWMREREGQKQEVRTTWIIELSVPEVWFSPANVLLMTPLTTPTL